MLAWKQMRFIASNRVRAVYSREHPLLFFIMVYNRLFFRRPLKFYYEAHEVFEKSRRFEHVVRRCDHVFCITAPLEKIIQNRYGVRSTSVLSDAVDLEKFDIAITKTEARRKLMLPPEGTFVVYTGHLYAWKGVETLAAACAHMPHGVSVYVVGGHEKDVEMFRKKWGSVSSLHIVGHKPHKEMPLWQKAADVLVLPNSGKETISVLYTSPVKLFEYMASGTPVVASDLPSLRDILDEGNACLVTPDDSRALAAGIQTMLSNKERAAEIAQRAHEDSKKYSWSARGRKIIDTVAV